jgi:Flp pilus assembly protein TadD
MLKSVPGPRTYREFDPAGSVAAAGGGAVLWARQGTIEAERGDLFDALRCFQRSLETDIDCLEAWIGLSEVFDRMRDRNRADACLEVARRIRCREVREATA